MEFLLDRKEGALLADDMGLGKTVQAIVALRQMFRRGSAQRALIVTPASVLTSWERHFRNWAPELDVLVMRGPKGDRHMLWQAFDERQAHVALATYDTYRNDAKDKRLPNVDVLVADEVHMLKNPSTKRTKAMRSQATKVRWGLSGTPLENNLDEFAAVLHFCAPMITRASDSRLALRHTAKQVILRRKKGSVLSQLPEIVSNVEYISLTDAERRAYDDAAGRARNELVEDQRSMARVSGHVQQLKQLCNGVGGSSAKLEWLEEHMTIVDEEDDKMLVFSQFRNSIDDIDSTLRRFDSVRFNSPVRHPSDKELKSSILSSATQTGVC